MPDERGVVERVAEAMLNLHRRRNGLEPTTLDQMRDEHRAEWIEDARAAIEAMREPTPGILAALRDNVPVYGHEWEYEEDEAPICWRAMIDAALSEPTGGEG